MSSTHSSHSCSYQKPGGLTCPWETMRSMRSPSTVSKSTKDSSGAPGGGSSLKRLRRFSVMALQNRIGQDAPEAGEVPGLDGAQNIACNPNRQNATGQPVLQGAFCSGSSASPLRFSGGGDPGVARPGSTTSSGRTPGGNVPLVVDELGSTGAPNIDRRSSSLVARRVAARCVPSVSFSKLRFTMSVPSP